MMFETKENKRGTKNMHEKLELRHRTRVIDICDQLIRNNETANFPDLYECVRELRKELSKI